MHTIVKQFDIILCQHQIVYLKNLKFMFLHEQLHSSRQLHQSHPEIPGTIRLFTSHGYDTQNICIRYKAFYEKQESLLRRIHIRTWMEM